jgi:TRAP-type C4-dicarboxylate transport system permease large subunit
MSGRDANYIALASVPFFCLMMLALLILVAFPQLATWLPDAVIGATRK